MKSVRSYLLLTFVTFFVGLLFGCVDHVTPLETLIRDQAAARLIKHEQTEKALDFYIKMLEKSPNEPAIHSNIGVILNQTQRSEEALKSFKLALALAENHKDAASAFAIRYNLGTYYGALKKVDAALENYQAALEIVPTSKETKHNIELLIQKQQQDKKDGDKGKSKDDPDQKDKKDGQDPDDKDKKQDGKDKPEDNKEGQKPQDQKEKQVQGNQKYKPRPFQGDQLSEGDVKKILGELRNQEQKIRANYDKKERKESNNEKDW